jgi:hypothetical protein
VFSATEEHGFSLQPFATGCFSWQDMQPAAADIVLIISMGLCSSVMPAALFKL